VSPSRANLDSEPIHTERARSAALPAASSEVPADPASPNAEAAARSAHETPADSNQLQVPVDIRSASLFVLATVACIFVLKQMQPVVVPIVLGALLFYALAPVVDWLNRWHVPRGLAASLVMVSLLAGAGGLAYSLSDEATAVVRSLPDTAEKLRRAVRGLRRQNNDSIAQMQKAAAALEQTATEAVGPPPTPRGVQRVQIEPSGFRVGDILMSGSQGVIVFAGQITTILFLTYFMLLWSPRLKEIAVSAAGRTLSKKKITLQIVNEITNQVQHFLLILALTSVLVGVATAVAMWWMGLNNATLWGFAAGVLNSVPYFGPLIVGAGLGAVAFVQFGTLTQAAAVAGVAVLITSLEGFLLTPFLQGRAARMNPVAVFIGILFWSWMGGAVGLLLAVPLTTVVKVVCDHIEELQPVGRLLGD
jgi:predicted PurR-regulated permease PerM